LLRNAYNHKADVWSLGCVFYELLTGFTPFTGKDKPDLVKNIEKGEYSIPKMIHFSLEGLSFLNSCLQFEAEKRLSFEDLINHPYITFDPRTEQKISKPANQLMMSYCPESGNLQAENYPNSHKNIIKSPHFLIKQNEDQVVKLNCKDES
jgi:serine/threonine protein kinase